MHVKTVEELLESGPMEFEAVTGTITGIDDRRTGGEGSKQWSVQNFWLQGQEKKIRCALWNQSELDAGWQGRKVYIVAGKGVKKTQFLSTEFGTGKYEKYLNLKIQSKATFTTKDPSAQSSTPPPQPQPPVQSPPSHQDPPLPPAPQHTPAMPPEQHQQEAPPHQASAPSAPTNVREAWVKADATLQTIRRGYLRCAMVANRILEDCKTLGIPFPEDGLQSMTATIFIQFKDRGGLMQVPDCDPVQPTKHAVREKEVDNDQDYRY